MNVNMMEDVDELTENVLLATSNELECSMAREYATRIADEIAPEVLEDMEECECDLSDGIAYGDLRLAIGRVLCRRLGLESRDPVQQP